MLLNISYLIDNCHNPDNFKIKDILSLQRSIDMYPYFEIAHILLAKILGSEGKQALQKCYIYASDRERLVKKLYISDRGINFEKISSEPEQEGHVSTQNSNFFTKKEDFEGFSNVSEKKIDREIVYNFLNLNIKFNPSNISAITPSYKEDLSKDSTTILSDEFATETLAKVLLSQGKKQGAINTYKKIILRHPEREEDLLPIINKLENDV